MLGRFDKSQGYKPRPSLELTKWINAAGGALGVLSSPASSPYRVSHPLLSFLPRHNRTNSPRKLFSGLRCLAAANRKLIQPEATASGFAAFLFRHSPA